MAIPTAAKSTLTPIAPYALCRNLAPAMQAHHLQLAVGHYGVFHGRRWQTETYPKVAEFIRAHSR